MKGKELATELAKVAALLMLGGGLGGTGTYQNFVPDLEARQYKEQTTRLQVSDTVTILKTELAEEKVDRRAAEADAKAAHALHLRCVRKNPT